MPSASYLELFGEFCSLKKGVNGPDVHMKAAGVGTRGCEFDEKVWRLAVYNNFCSTPSAAVVWARTKPEHLTGDLGISFEDWVGKNWAGIPIRQNRRPARSVKKLTRSFVTLAFWLDQEFPSVSQMTYEEAWDSLDAVYTWGRYVKVKFLETCRRYLGPEYAHLESPDIHAAGGWSPRKALALMYPEYANFLVSKRDDKRTIANIHSVADELRQYVTEQWIDVSNYELEALLCNFRQTLSERKTFYVGRTIDSELEYDRKIREFWGDDPYLGTFDFFKTRQSAFPAPCLGEVMGWDGVRFALSDVLRNYGYIWSDVKYDYNASEDDLRHPVRWQ